MERNKITGVIHLVRHGRVENPGGVIYGRLPEFRLSELGRRQAKESAEYLAERDVGAIWASPLERAQETAAEIGRHHDLAIVTDDRLLESDTRFEGVTRAVVPFLSSPRNWWYMRNPWTPSWGESFKQIRDRVLDAIAEASESAQGEVVIVAHQTPVVVARKALAGSWGPPWLGRVNCTTGSVTTMVMEEGRLESAAYFAPSG